LKQIISPVKNQDLLIMEKETHKVLEKMINQLNLREQDIVKQINGFGSSSKVTLQSLGDKYSISRTRVGEIYRIAIRKLSHCLLVNASSIFISNRSKTFSATDMRFPFSFMGFNFPENKLLTAP